MTQTTDSQQIDIFQKLLGDPQRSQEKPIDLPYYTGLIWRRRWLVIAIFCVAMISGIRRKP